MRKNEQQMMMTEIDHGVKDINSVDALAAEMQRTTKPIPKQLGAWVTPLQVNFSPRRQTAHTLTPTTTTDAQPLQPFTLATRVLVAIVILAFRNTQAFNCGE